MGKHLREESPFKSLHGWRRVLRAFTNSMAGLHKAYKYEAAFRQETILAAILIPLALFLPIQATEKALLIASVMLVLIVELVNSAIEAAIDRISLDLHKLSKRAKDLGSAAVFMSIVQLIAVWSLVLIQMFR